MQARRRRSVAVLGACAALLGLTGCERPTPLVSVYSGNTTLNDHALSFCFPGQDPAKEPGTPGACRFDAEGRTPEVLEVKPGDQVVIDVDKDLVESGWTAVLRAPGAQPGRLAVQDEHVAYFEPDFSRAPQLTLEVLKLDGPRDDARPVGIWQFVLVASN